MVHIKIEGRGFRVLVLLAIVLLPGLFTEELNVQEYDYEPFSHLFFMISSAVFSRMLAHSYILFVLFLENIRVTGQICKIFTRISRC